ncbi:membrane protein [Paenibacillus darwinianus]|uniref:Membrane protein n=1 Tax=Paenibacillus darwinianus TaxID=1380763 RepID=A0A9W5RZU3_9BACL|nr:DUF421 domain-containing protein [Paenibacillus darwinianus]EXX85258.1 membrane protein [Paenibacillus darwinianus]EXX88509.1 membrane protein [Paenibacillus darwinianus]EXX88799.1 membrane protein [Paenibacillus darwinianus]
MQDIGALILRTILTYFVVFFVMRMMGKREIGKLSVFDLVISVMIAEIAVFVIEDTDRHPFHSYVPMVTLMIIQIGISLIIMRFRGLRMMFDGKPTIVIAKGKLNREAMRKQRYNLDDLMLQLRENKIASIGDVEFAILETSGKLSVIKKETPIRLSRPATYASYASLLDDHRIDEEKEPIFPPKFRFEMLPIPLIMDGKVQDDNLEKLGKNRFWLKNELQQKGSAEFKEVFLCTIDHNGKLFIDYARKPNGQS